MSATRLYVHIYECIQAYYRHADFAMMELCLVELIYQRPMFKKLIECCCVRHFPAWSLHSRLRTAGEKSSCLALLSNLKDSDNLILGGDTQGLAQAK